MRPPELLVEPNAEPNPILELDEDDDDEEDDELEELLDELRLPLLLVLLPEREEDELFDDELRLPLVPLPASTSIRSNALRT
ncbi:hypothetical protein OS31_47140 [Dickeya oryzae]